MAGKLPPRHDRHLRMTGPFLQLVALTLLKELRLGACSGDAFIVHPPSTHSMGVACLLITVYRHRKLCGKRHQWYVFSVSGTPARTNIFQTKNLEPELGAQRYKKVGQSGMQGGVGNTGAWSRR